uniref:Uncharacterized protein n=1 Tax=Amphora coffeiformis TaxID=265554 RepID=A0A7S3PCZ7_9STRA
MKKIRHTVTLLSLLVLGGTTHALVTPSSSPSKWATTITTKSTTTTTALSSQKFRPSNKQQAKVAIDPKTGLYRPIKTVDNQGKRLRLPEDGLSTWETVKEAVYNGVDGIKDVPKKVAKKNKDSSSLPSGVVGGYADLEREFLEGGSKNNKKKKIPIPFLGSSPSTPVDQIVQAKKEDIKSSTGGRNNKNDPLIPPTGLEKAKKIFWGSVDAVNQPKRSSSSSASTASTTTASAAMESFQPAVRARMVASDEFLQALSNLESPNPVVRLAAGRKIQSLAKSEQAKLQNAAVREDGTKKNSPLQTVQQSFWKAADTVQATKEQIVDLPRRVANTYKATLETVDKTVATATQVPYKVQKQVEAVKSTINYAFDTTQKTVKIVKELPARIETNVKETNQNIQKKVQQTQETAWNIKESVETLTTQSKVLLGLEKPKPKPPNTPPPEPLTPQKAALKVLSITGSLAGQVGWFVSKESAKLAWKAASVAATKGGEVLITKVKEYQEQQKQQASKPKLPPVAVAKTLKLPAKETKKSTPAAPVEFTEEMLATREQQQKKEMSELEMEIEEALRMADAAIQSAQAEIEESKSKIVNKNEKSDDGDDDDISKNE